jgi:hypothetical protein
MVLKAKRVTLENRDQEVFLVLKDSKGFRVRKEKMVSMEQLVLEEKMV